MGSTHGQRKLNRVGSHFNGLSYSGVLCILVSTRGFGRYRIGEQPCSDEPAHAHSLVRALAVHKLKEGMLMKVPPHLAVLDTLLFTLIRLASVH